MTLEQLIKQVNDAGYCLQLFQYGDRTASITGEKCRWDATATDKTGKAISEIAFGPSAREALEKLVDKIERAKAAKEAAADDLV